MIKQLSLAASIVALSISAQADIQFIAGLELMNGGDELSKIQFENDTSETVRVGSGIAIGGGALYVQDKFDLGARIKYFFDDASGETADKSVKVDFSFKRIPVDFVGHYRLGNHHIGGGLTYHMNPEFTSKINSNKNTVKFDDALGAMVEYKYQFSKGGALLLRYTSIEYKLSDGGKTFDGNSFGIGGEINF